MICMDDELASTSAIAFASDRDDAEQQARKIQKEQGYERLDLKAYPYGFVMHRSRITGMMEQAESI